MERAQVFFFDIISRKKYSFAIMNRKSVTLHTEYTTPSTVKNFTTAKLHFPLKLNLIKTHSEGIKFFVATLSLRYPGCKSLFVRGLRFRG